jgi:hypothetical protein
LKGRGFQPRRQEPPKNRALQFAEKLGLGTSGAKALIEIKGFIAALKALRHPKPSF